MRYLGHSPVLQVRSQPGTGTGYARAQTAMGGRAERTVGLQAQCSPDFIPYLKLTPSKWASAPRQDQGGKEMALPPPTEIWACDRNTALASVLTPVLCVTQFFQ